jgi:excisionase family DNA binding protein
MGADADNGAGFGEYMTPGQISVRLQVDMETVYRWIRRGDLKASRLGGGGGKLWRVRRADFDDFMRRGEVRVK